MPKMFVRSPAFAATLAALAVFWICTFFFKPDELSDATSTMIALFSGLGLWRWGPTGARVFWKGARRPEDWGIVALCALFVAMICARTYGIIYRQLERPDWLHDQYWSPFFLYLLLLAITLLVAATKDEPPRPPQ